MPAAKTLKICPEGHRFYKTANCNTCPRCEAARKPESVFLAALSAPARRALEQQGIISLEILSKWSESELLALHGIGKSTLPKLKTLLLEQGLCFKTHQQSQET